MTLHLLKLAVGAANVQDMFDWCARPGLRIVHTRNTPKRAQELLDGGSLYWVVKGRILVRQKVVGIETIGSGGSSRCEINLSKDVVLTAPQPRRAFQGWRYLAAGDAPPDLEKTDEDVLPSDLAGELRDIGAW